MNYKMSTTPRLKEQFGEKFKQWTPVSAMYSPFESEAGTRAIGPTMSR